ncbi:MAG: hypothetical protein EZS28_043063, partial [Streblomastix strix]
GGSSEYMSEISSLNPFQSQRSDLSLSELEFGSEQNQKEKEKEKEKEFVPTEFQLKLDKKYSKFLFPDEENYEFDMISENNQQTEDQ